MLLQVRDYIRKAGLVSTQQISRALQIDSLALQPLLDLWVNKGVIEQCSAVKACGSSCLSRCGAQSRALYQVRLYD